MHCILILHIQTKRIEQCNHILLIESGLQRFRADLQKGMDPEVW